MIKDQKSYDNLQDIFNDIYLGMIAQGESCFGAFGCRYRLDDKACAIGMVLSNETINRLGLIKVNPALMSSDNLKDRTLIDFTTPVEKESAESIRDILLPNLDKDLRADFLHDMQRCHDECCTKKFDSYFIDRFKSKAAMVASKYKLTIPDTK